MVHRTRLCVLEVLALSVFAAAAPTARAQAVVSDSTMVLTSGTADISLAPDRATVRASIQATASRAVQAAGAISATVRAVVDSLTTLGFARDSIRTVDVSVWPSYDRDGRRVTGYGAAASVEVVVRDFGKLGRAVDAVLAGGATSVAPITFESDSLDWGKRRALAAAFADARVQAEALALAAGGRVGRLVLVTTDAGRALLSPTPPQFSVAQVLTPQPGVVSPSVTPQAIHVQATVYCRWTLERSPSH